MVSSIERSRGLIAMDGKGWRGPGRDSLVQDVQLLGRCVLLEELRGHFALGGEYDAIVGEDADCRAGEGDGFKSILDLVEPTLRGEDGGLE